MAEVMFYRLLVTVDDFGRFDARPAMIKSQCFPIKEKTTPKHCEEAIKELCEAGLLMVYVVDNKPYLQILKWDNVPRSKESKFPAPVDGCMHLYTSACNPRTVLPVTVTVTVTETKTDNRKQKPDADASPPEGVSDQTWKDWLQLRKTKRAPVTQTVINGAISEASKAGMHLEQFLQIWCRRGSQGLEAAWLRPDEKQQTGETVYQRTQREKMQAWAPGIAAKAPGYNEPFTLEAENVTFIEGN